ncbi:hypothetical protein [Alkalicoccus daliensis]|uniref:Uncharacterized protein n=1 Tax=Alkalicoccus daliensis TaxID=745820 RepID=A0A1H0GZN1_9BACI|nr:hypothetical protein [Alkalicoccus daliensis]SDO12141.1 hypothetical protein SAMN04488053_107103 [Alkalicoccus daliensis]
MDKRITTLSIFCIAALLTSGCIDENSEEDETGFAGRYAGYLNDELVIFVEDNLGGKRVVPTAQAEFNREDYSVEGYRVSVTEETSFIYAETEEETSMASSNLRALFGYPLEVEIGEDFSAEVQENQADYFQTNPEILPLYEAEEIRLLPLEMEDFTHFVSTFYLSANGMTSEDEGYLVILTNGSNEITEEFQRNQEIYDDALDKYRSEDVHISTGNNESFTWRLGEESLSLQEIMEEFNLPEEYMENAVYLVFSTEEFLTVEEEWQGVINYFEENIS